jgi:CRISPR/Cas system-associated exonuclease Cas4 (RecB family)
MGVIQKITAWSFSRLQDYRKCPAFAKYKHVDKIKEPGNDAMARGGAIGKMAEDFIKGTLKKCPPEIKSFEEEFKELRKRKAVTEDQWTFDKDWHETGWFDADAWLRIKTDIYSLNRDTNTLLVVDNKTGRIREEHLEQLKLYAMGALLKFPTVDAVDVRLWYLDACHEVPEEPKLYTRKELPALKTYWLKETKAMLNDTRFAPKPSSNCRYCFFSKANKGPCQY